MDVNSLVLRFIKPSTFKALPINSCVNMVIKRKSKCKVKPKIFNTKYTCEVRTIQKILVDKTLPTNKVAFIKTQCQSNTLDPLVKGIMIKLQLVAVRETRFYTINFDMINKHKDFKGGKIIIDSVSEENEQKWTQMPPLGSS